VAVYTHQAEIELLERRFNGSTSLTPLSTPLDTLTSLHGMSMVAFDYATAPCNGLSLFSDNKDDLCVTFSTLAGSGFSCTLSKGDPMESLQTQCESIHKERWRQWAFKVDQKCQWAKKPSVWKVFQREAQDQERKPIPDLLERPKWQRGKKLNSKRLKKKKGIAIKEKNDEEKQNPVETETTIAYKACPSLPPFNVNRHNDEEGSRILKILKREPGLHPELACTSEDTAFFFPKDLLRGRKRVRKLPAEGEDDPNYTMDAFLSGIEPAMTSTQEQQQPETERATSSMNWDDNWGLDSFNQMDNTPMKMSQNTTIGASQQSAMTSSSQQKSARKKRLIKQAGF